MYFCCNKIKIIKPLFAIVDLETTGRLMSDIKIIEIAICISDGNNIIDKYTTLVKPNQKIDFFVSKLTGITNSMVAESPCFEDISFDIYNILKDKILVAHNCVFDYNVLKKEFLSIGIEYESNVYCTLSGAKKYYKTQLSSFSLGNICNYFDIELKNAHRASDDTYATTLFFHKLIQDFSLDKILNDAYNNNVDFETPEYLSKKLNTALANKKGVVRFYQENNLIYISSSESISKKMYSIIKSYEKKDLKTCEIVDSSDKIEIEYFDCFAKAQVVELNEIQQKKPIHNKIFKSQNNQYVTTFYQMENGLYNFKILPYKKSTANFKFPYILNPTYVNAEKFLKKMILTNSMLPIDIIQKRLENIDCDITHNKLIKKYNNILLNCFKPYCFDIQDGYYIFKNINGNVEGVKIENYYVSSWIKSHSLTGNYEEIYENEVHLFEINKNPKTTKAIKSFIEKIPYKVIDKKNESLIINKAY